MFINYETQWPHEFLSEAMKSKQTPNPPEILELEFAANTAKPISTSDGLDVEEMPDINIFLPKKLTLILKSPF